MKTIKSKYQPKQTNVTWIDLSGEKPVEKHYINGKWVAVSGGGGDTKKYSDLEEKPLINGVELDGNKTSQDLGVYSKPSSGIPQSDLTQSVQTSLNKADTAYQKPLSGITESDLSSDVQQALQKHFKGWYNTLAELKAAHTATEGDSAYVKDASPATTWSIYVYDATATTDNNWADSGTDADTSNVQTFATGEEVNETPIDDTHLVNPADGALAKAEDALPKVKRATVENYSNVDVDYTQTGYYINENGGRSSAEGYTIKQYQVTPGQKYYISGSTGTSSTAVFACFVKNLTKWSGTGILVTGGEYVERGKNLTISRMEVTAPEGALGIRVQQRDSVTSYHANCEVKTSVVLEQDNQDIIDSVGDVDDLDTTNKSSIVGAINELNDNIKKHLKVLLIGSSHGVNTISMFPILAYHAGIDIVCGNLYKGSATLGLYSTRPAVQIPYMADNDVSFERFAVYENGEWATETTKTISYALGLKEWDVIILQRGASEDYWDESISNFYQHLLDYIKDNCSYVPRIYFNSGIADAKRFITDCLEQTNTLMATAFQQKSQFGIDVIPTAVAVQYARETCLKETGQDLGSANYYKCMACDAQHLDTGIGQYVTGCTVFEKIIGDFFNMSVRELAYLPIYDDVSENVVNAGSQYFTPITDYYSRVAKTCASLAVIDGNYNAETATYLSTKYGDLPSNYTVTANLTGCSLNNEALSVSSYDVYMARLILDSGMTTVSVVVTVGGEDVTTSVYATYDGYYAIRIGEITGNIVITASAS